MLTLDLSNLMIILLNVFFFVPSTLLGLYGAYVVLRMLGLIVGRPRS